MTPEGFMSRIEMVPEAGCWLWMGGVSSRGYGQVRENEHKTYQAHRFSWALHRGPIPAGMHVCHRCDVPNCVNPAHLFLGTAFDNMRDCARKGRMGMQRMPEKSYFATEAGRRSRYTAPAKLNAAQVAELRRRIGEGESINSIARDFGVSKTTIARNRNFQPAGQDKPKP